MSTIRSGSVGDTVEVKGERNEGKRCKAVEK